MRVPLLDLKAQLEQIEEPLRSQLDDVLASCQFIMGPKVASLEQEIASYVGVSQAIGVSSGTDALLIALMAENVGPGDLVLTTPYSFFATAGAVARLGATPVFVDIDPVSYNLDSSSLRHWFDSNPKDRNRVKAVIPVHLYGQCAEMDEVIKLKEEFGFAIIEDAAQSIGSRYRTAEGLELRAGSLGDYGCFSFFPSKNLGGVGDGGMVVTNDADKADKLRKLRNHGSSPKYYHQLIGGNFRLDAIQAAALLAKLPLLESWHASRQGNASYYDAALSGIPAIGLPTVMQHRSFHIYNQYVIRTSKRDELREHLAESKIGTEVYYPVPFHTQECFQHLGYQPGDFPHALAAANETLAIPIYPELTRPMQDYVVDSIGRFYE